MILRVIVQAFPERSLADPPQQGEAPRGGTVFQIDWDQATASPFAPMRLAAVFSDALESAMAQARHTAEPGPKIIVPEFADPSR